MEKQKGTMLDPGSEFRDEAELAPIWGRHEYWDQMREITFGGVSYPLSEVTEEERVEDLNFMIQRSNHKSARTPKENANTLLENYKTEVEKG